MQLHRVRILNGAAEIQNEESILFQRSSSFVSLFVIQHEDLSLPTRGLILRIEPEKEGRLEERRENADTLTRYPTYPFAFSTCVFARPTEWGQEARKRGEGISFVRRTLAKKTPAIFIENDRTIRERERERETIYYRRIARANGSACFIVMDKNEALIKDLKKNRGNQRNYLENEERFRTK